MRHSLYLDDSHMTLYGWQGNHINLIKHFTNSEESLLEFESVLLNEVKKPIRLLVDFLCMGFL